MTERSSRPSTPPAKAWRAVAVSVVASLLVAGAGGLVTWGNTSARIEHTEVQVAQLREEQRAERLRHDNRLQELEIKINRTEVAAEAVRSLMIEINRRLARIEDHIDHRRTE